MREKIVHEGIILRIENSTAFVSIQPESSCSACQVKSYCQGGDEQGRVMEVKNVDSSFRDGETVLIVSSSSGSYRAVLYAYVLPLILLLLTLRGGISLLQDEALAACLALLVAGLYYTSVFLFRNKMKKQFSFSLKHTGTL